MINRRDFLQSLAALTAGMMLSPNLEAQDSRPATGPGATPSDKLGRLLPLRKLGRTGQAVTMLGLGGYHLGAMYEKDPRLAQQTIEIALEGGVRFFDNAESYANKPGTAEEAYGKFLTPKYREHVFLMTKSFTHDENGRATSGKELAATSRKHLEGSLKRLNTDYLDLWQIHSLQSVADAEDRVLGGQLDVFLEAKAKGLVKHIGFTGHHLPQANHRMLELMAQREDVLETCQMPINVLDPNYRSFIEGVLPALVQRQYGVLAMKTLAGGNFFSKSAAATQSAPPAVVPDRVSLEQAMHFVWSLPVSCLISGPDTPAQFQQMIGLARSFQAMDEAKRKDLVAKVADLAGNRSPQHIEWYKPHDYKAPATTQKAQAEPSINRYPAA